MPIKLPPNAKPITDRRLTLIRVISTLAAEDGYLDQLKDDVKKTMKEKEADFAQSDFAIGQLRSSGERSFIPVKKLYALVKDRKISMDQFLECVKVSAKPLKKFLSGEEIEKISCASPAGDGSLFTELKPGVSLDIDCMEEALCNALRVAPQA
jgi:hypothetical protein